MSVVGGGPAGLMAAERLAAGGARVTVHERMPSVGRKLLVAGRGGLNLTHDEPLEQFLDRYGPARARLERAVRAFGPDHLRAWCDGLGQPTFVGSSRRVFPESFRATALLAAWLDRLEGLGVQIQVGRRWEGWAGDRLVFATDTDGRVEVHADATVLALGGASWPRTGSDGAWVPVLAGGGVTVQPLRPANCGFVVGWSGHFTSRFAGRPLKNVRLTVWRAVRPGGGAPHRRRDRGHGRLRALGGAARRDRPGRRRDPPGRPAPGRPGGGAGPSPGRPPPEGVRVQLAATSRWPPSGGRGPPA